MTYKKLVVCEDHMIVYEGLKMVLEQDNNFKVLGHAKLGRELIPVLQKIKPDILILDLNLPDGDGIQRIYEVRKLYPDLIIVILTMHKESSLIIKSRNAGANAYILKDTGNTELITILKKASLSEFQLAGKVNMRLDSENESQFAQKASLTKREKEIIKLVCSGFSTQKIADALSLSFYTVETHRKNIAQKLNIHSVADLIKFANENTAF